MPVKNDMKYYLRNNIRYDKNKWMWIPMSRRYDRNVFALT